ncbi:ribonuclease P protein component 4 [Diplogelasinospora grovesii]|uniref:Ribonuclease P protein component 4 n=1 Tax=Diplogelasinospora grovesii TaxID=303347 RepID=A0AAN6N6R0_9PEZI|nr:ribonuclease P protein component 4 [Diplogelasinospora grovesii]
MGKGKSGGSGVQNKALYSRISFLQQAAVLLSTPQQHVQGSSAPASTGEPGSNHEASLKGMSRRLATDLRNVSLKSRIRLTPAVKQTVCKYCDSILIDGESCNSLVENKSKGGKKPWADVLVRKCHMCGRERRYPVSTKRQKRRSERNASSAGASVQKQSG